jgi:hypothetical protein
MVLPPISLYVFKHMRFQLLTDAEPRSRGVSGENAHYGCTGADHHFRRFNDTNLSGGFLNGLTCYALPQTFRYTLTTK